MHNRYVTLKHLKFDVYTESLDGDAQFTYKEIVIHYSVDRKGDATHLSSQITTPHGEWVLGMANGVRSAAISHRHWLKPMVFDLKREFPHLYLGRLPPLTAVSLHNDHSEGGPEPGIRLAHMDVEIPIGGRCAMSMRLYPHPAGQGIYQQRNDLRTEAREIYSLNVPGSPSQSGVQGLIHHPEVFREEELQGLFWISPTWRVVSLATLPDVPDEEFIQFFSPSDPSDHPDTILAS